MKIHEVEILEQMMQVSSLSCYEMDRTATLVLTRGKWFEGRRGIVD